MMVNFSVTYEKFKNSDITQRQFISLCKSRYIDDVIKMTSFLDMYENVSINERLFYLIKSITEVVKCPYCGNKACFTGRINDGYRQTCSSKECRSKYMSEHREGNSNISSERLTKFLEEEKSIVNVDDDIIKKMFKYDKFVNNVTNEHILSYLKNRYDDSKSILETVQRIRLGEEHSPKCPVCGNSVSWIGRSRALWATYCSNECSNSSEIVKIKKKETQKKNWGTENCYDSEKYKSKVKEKYGVEYLTQVESVKNKSRKSKIKRFGSMNVFSDPTVKERMERTNMERYGYKCAFQSESVRRKMCESQIKNSHSMSSSMEDEVYQYFLNIGYNPKRHYMSDVFCYNVDFYIEELDLYIEYQGSQYHNGRAFVGNGEDLKELEVLRKKSELLKLENGNKKTQYDAIIETWTFYDVKKRNKAEELGLNYLEIYSCASDIDLKNQIDLYLKCKNGINPFSYSDKVLQNEFSYYSKCSENLPNTVGNRHSIVKHFNGGNFYRNEMEIYAKSSTDRRKVIQNRIEYLKKKESELTVNDIIGGFKKSGLHYGYSHFNPMWTNWFVNKFSVKKIYDPCGGWGHHILGMQKCEKIFYNDIDKDVTENVKKMWNYFGMNNGEFTSFDARQYYPNENVDAWFMCPPYFNVEIYKNEPFKSLEDYKEFLNDIFLNWKKSSAKWFGIIIREDFSEFIKEKPTEIHNLNNNSVHISKDKIEVFMVFCK